MHENPHRNLNATDPGSNTGVHIFRVHALNVAAATLQKVRTLQKGTDHAIMGFKAKIPYHPVGKNTQVRHNPVYYFRKYQVRARSPPIHSWAQYVNAHMEGNATST